MSIDLKQFLAKQLNDHKDSPSGVVQATFYEWTEEHISDAIHLGLCYLYSLLPQEFSKLKVYEVLKTDCVFDFCNVCEKFVGIVDVEIDGVGCIEVTKVDNQVNSLIGLLSISCPVGQNDESVESGYSWDVVDGSNCVVKFDREIKSGSEIRYMCASPPEGVDIIHSENLCEYLPLIADYALWWLFRTDSESRSNLDRAKLHFEGVKDFVTTKLLLEFSLQEDDYNFGRRKVDD